VTTFRPDECIYRVPSTLRDFNEAASIPQVISIGPIRQHDNKALKAVEDQKWRYMKDFFGVRIQKEKRKERLTTLLSAIKDDDAAIRLRYVADISEICSEKFVKMILYIRCCIHLRALLEESRT
jgi:3'-phosphoadenosine 5'-phosphosulfate sulfotransferase